MLTANYVDLLQSIALIVVAIGTCMAAFSAWRQMKATNQLWSVITDLRHEIYMARSDAASARLRQRALEDEIASLKNQLTVVKNHQFKN